jgi:hypothetical protein
MPGAQDLCLGRVWLAYPPLRLLMRQLDLWLVIGVYVRGKEELKTEEKGGGGYL